MIAPPQTTDRRIVASERLRSAMVSGVYVPAMSRKMLE